MAMLMMNAIFERTWGKRAGTRPSTEYWVEITAAVKHKHPEFLFIAEAYWDLEWELQQQGFDFCYDKRLYDRLEHESAESVGLHLCGEAAYQNRLLRFIENHDEPRAASAFAPNKERVAALVSSTVLGARLFHEGQFEGRKVKLPVFLGRRPKEPVDDDLRNFYSKLLLTIKNQIFREGGWHLCERSGWPDNQSFENILAWTWVDEEDRHLIVVNLSSQQSQALIKVADDKLRGNQWQLTDAFSGEAYVRGGDEMVSTGLYVDLQPWGYHCLGFSCGAKNETKT
jgi:hypothetical protein